VVHCPIRSDIKIAQGDLKKFASSVTAYDLLDRVVDPRGAGRRPESTPEPAPAR
jgi:hypothetical protein